MIIYELFLSSATYFCDHTNKIKQPRRTERLEEPWKWQISVQNCHSHLLYIKMSVNWCQILHQGSLEKERIHCKSAVIS